VPDSYVIREDDYINYMARATDISKIIPPLLVTKLRESNLLFLGYSLRDWNLRVILHRIWEAERSRCISWAIQETLYPYDPTSWTRHNVDAYEEELLVYAEELKKRI
jgi:hypothetical protein